MFEASEALQKMEGMKKKNQPCSINIHEILKYVKTTSIGWPLSMSTNYCEIKWLPQAETQVNFGSI